MVFRASSSFRSVLDICRFCFLIVAICTGSTAFSSFKHCQIGIKTNLVVWRSHCPKAHCFALGARASSKWDQIDDEEGDDNDRLAIPVPPDMTYEPRNAKRQHEYFLDIRGVGGKDLTNDVYARVPGEDVFWYVGKVARISDVPLEDCIARQWNMIESHATNLRPIELYAHRGKLEIWTAPGDSELDVAYNRPHIQMVKHTPRAMTSRDLKNNFVGFQGEIYQQGEEGFRTWRTEQGLPARPEINPGGETRPPTDEEYAQIQKELQGKDITKIYEEQDRLKNRGNS